MVIFDLDGTLVDSVPDIAAAVDATAIAADLSPPGESQVRQWVGNGSRKLIERLLQAGFDRPPEKAELDDAHELFLAAYGSRLVQDSRLYPGVLPLLESLAEHRIPMACVSNKPEALTHGVLQGLSLDGFFSWVLGGDSLAQRKPAPEPLWAVMEQAGVPAANSVLLGDSEADVGAARAAGCSVLVVKYGYNQGFVGSDVQPDAFLNDLSELTLDETTMESDF
nr:phosphoglycolate phosphatase [Natronospira proteinivora]